MAPAHVPVLVTREPKRQVLAHVPLGTPGMCRMLRDSEERIFKG